MLQQMRSLAKYIWVLVALVFVGGFLLYETSGLMGRTPVTPTTPVAVVNGHEIRYNDWLTRVQNEIQVQQQNQGRSLTQDDTRRIEQTVFDQMVAEVLLNQEYRRRGIIVTDDEIKEYARYAPPSWITSAPELQTEGRFDPQKYQRLLSSPQARQGGLLQQLEIYYRSEIPREKLFDQVSAGVYVTDAELWRAWRDQHDSAQVSYVGFRAALDTNAVKSINDSDIQKYFDAHKSEFQRQGRAVLSVVSIPKTISASDTAAALDRASKLRGEIAGGAKFEDVAKRESADTISGQQGGDLGRGGKDRFVPEFEKAAYALKVGEVSTPVLTPFGYHIIRVDEHKGDTLALRHILVRIQASDSSATATDRRADQLSTLAASTTGQPRKLDTAATKLGLAIQKIIAVEDEPATLNGTAVPSVSAWAFGGARVGETSELFDDERGYYLARLDSISEGGEPKLANVRQEVAGRLAAQRQIDQLMGEAERLASAAAASSLDDAAAKQNLKVSQTPMFTRASFVPGIGQFNEAIGAAFSLPTGAVSAPVKTTDGVYILRVDKRVVADSAAWVKQKDLQRQQRLASVRQQKIQLFLDDLRKSAKLEDRRKAINASVRRTDV